MDYFLNFEKMSYVKGEKYDGCILCSLSEKQGDLVNLSIMEDDDFIVTVNLYPYNPGHLFVFPRRHVIDLRELSEKQETRLSNITRGCINLLDRTHSPAAYNIGYNMGLAAGASIEHLHRHIIPRYPRETGIADLIAGKRVLVESPMVTRDRLKAAIEAAKVPFF